jgi:protein ImuB
MLAEVEPVLARRGEARVGIADGVFAARLAARSVDARSGPVVIAPGGAREFLAGIPIDALEMPKLVDVLSRLGLHTLGAFADLPATSVVGRFGRDGQLAHRLAQGEDDYPPDLRRPAPDLAVTWQFEPPAERIDGCAFVVKMLADDLHEALDARGLACIRVAIEAETEHGETQLRLWRHEGALSAAAIADRSRWQLDGWLRRTPSGLGSGIVRLTLVPDEVVPARGRQLGFWGDRNQRADDVTRVVARIQALLGPEAVTVPEWRGGLGPADRIALVPAAAVDLGEERPAAASSWVPEPWPDRMPAPAPARIHPSPLPVELLDGEGHPVGVSGRGEMSERPVALRAPGSRPRDGGKVVGWAGPWPADQRWWDPLTQRRRARLQVTVDDGSAHLLMIEHGRWWIEATYD